MTEGQAIQLMFRGLLSELSEDDQLNVQEAAEFIRSVVAEYGTNGFLALTLVSAEKTAESN